jgi:hypothetical protein
MPVNEEEVSILHFDEEAAHNADNAGDQPRFSMLSSRRIVSVVTVAFVVGCATMIAMHFLPVANEKPADAAIEGVTTLFDSEAAHTNVDCTPNSEESQQWTDVSTVENAVHTAVDKAWKLSAVERKTTCGLGRFVSSPESFLHDKVNNRTHTLHAQQKFDQYCGSETYRLSFHIKGDPETSFQIEVNHDFQSETWKFLSANPPVCEISTGSASAPQVLSAKSKSVRDASKFAAGEVFSQMRAKGCFDEKWASSDMKVLKAYTQVQQGLQLLLDLEFTSGTETQHAYDLAVQTVCGRMDTCYNQLSLGADANVCNIFKRPRRLYPHLGALPEDQTESWAEQREYLVRGRELGTSRYPLGMRHIQTGSVPSAFDPRDEDCYSKITVYNQGKCGSCYAQGVAQMVGIRLCLLEKKRRLVSTNTSVARHEESTAPRKLGAAGRELSAAQCLAKYWGTGYTCANTEQYCTKEKTPYSSMGDGSCAGGTWITNHVGTSADACFAQMPADASYFGFDGQHCAYFSGTCRAAVWQSWKLFKTDSPAYSIVGDGTCKGGVWITSAPGASQTADSCFSKMPAEAIYFTVMSGGCAFFKGTCTPENTGQGIKMYRRGALAFDYAGAGTCASGTWVTTAWVGGGASPGACFKKMPSSATFFKVSGNTCAFFSGACTVYPEAGSYLYTRTARQFSNVAASSTCGGGQAQWITTGVGATADECFAKMPASATYFTTNGQYCAYFKGACTAVAAASWSLYTRGLLKKPSKDIMNECCPDTCTVTKTPCECDETYVNGNSCTFKTSPCVSKAGQVSKATIGTCGTDVDCPEACVDKAGWSAFGQGTYDCAFFNGKCTAYTDYGQLTNCKHTCGMCPAQIVARQNAANPWHGAWYQYMPSTGQMTPCSANADGSPTGCDGGNMGTVWNNWMRKMTTNLQQMGQNCLPYNYKCWTATGVVNPLSGGQCSAYTTYQLWHKPCNCIPKADFPSSYTCPSGPPTSSCSIAVPPAAYYIKGMNQGLSNAETVLNMQRHITEFGPIWVAYMTTEGFMNMDWKTNPIYCGVNKGANQGGHVVNGVGWGTSGSTDYWILRNSWGANYADKGYFKFLRGRNLDGIESRGLAVTMPTSTFADWSPPQCSVESWSTTYQKSGSALTSYKATIKVMCSKAATLRVFVSNYITNHNQIYNSVSGHYYSLSASAKTLTSMSPIQFCNKGFGLQKYDAWVQIQSTDTSGNTAYSSQFITLNAVPGASSKSC